MAALLDEAVASFDEVVEAVASFDGVVKAIAPFDNPAEADAGLESAFLFARFAPGE